MPVTFEDTMNVGGGFQPKSELAKRAEGKREQVAELDTVPKFLEEERRRGKAASALSEARAQTKFMQEHIGNQRRNFDNSLRNQRRLAKIDKVASKRLLESEMRFNEDSANRKYLTERQLADWYNTKAKTEEDWKNFSQRQTQLHERKMRVLQAAYQKIEQTEQQLYQTYKTGLDRSTREYLAQRKREVEAKIAREKANAANKSALVSGLATVGVAAGLYLSGGNPAGAAAGGALGTAAGMAVSDQT